MEAKIARMMSLESENDESSSVEEGVVHRVEMYSSPCIATESSDIQGLSQDLICSVMDDEDDDKDDDEDDEEQANKMAMPESDVREAEMIVEKRAAPATIMKKRVVTKTCAMDLEVQGLGL